jgi:hypothetical protein
MVDSDVLFCLYVSPRIRKKQCNVLYDALRSSLALLRYELPPSHICPVGGSGSTFFVVYRAAMASMERSNSLGTWWAGSVRGGLGVDDQDTSLDGLPVFGELMIW